MSIVGRLPQLNRFLNLALSDPKAWNPSLWNLAGSQDISGSNVNEATALTYSAVWNAVNLYAGALSTLPLHLCRTDSNKTIKVTEKRLYHCLHSSFNKIMTAQVGRSVMIAHLLTWGNCFAEKVRNGYGEITELWPISPNRVRITMEEGQLIYEIQVDNQTYKFTRDKILHIPGLGFDGYQGYSVISMARKSIGLGMAMETFGALFFGQGTHPGITVSHPTTLKDPKGFREAFAAEYEGLSNAHRVMLLQEGMKIEKIGIPPEDAQFLQCVVPETMISMADGTRKAAKDICQGDNVVTWENNKLSNSFVSAIGKPPIKNLIKIRTARGRELIASEDHPVLAIEKLRTPGGRPAKISPSWIFMKDLKIGSYVKIALDFPSMSEEDGMTADEGYFLGAMAGDGYIRRGTCSFTNEDSGVISHMGEVVQSFGGKLNPRPCKYNDYNYEIITNGKNGCKGSRIRTLLNNSEMVGKHSHTKEVPQSVILGGINAWKGFLSGYFDTDGSIREQSGQQKPAMYWSSTSLLMLQGCQHLLAMLGVQSSIYPMHMGGMKKVMGKSCKTLPSWGLYIMGISQIKKASEMFSLYHINKSKRLLEYFTVEPSRYRDENFQYDRVVLIEELGEGETVGIEIFGCHTHVTGGIITHNSREFQIPEIARWFNLPVHRLKDMSRSTNNNIEAESASYVTDSLLPVAINIEQNLDLQLLTYTQKYVNAYYFRHNFDGLLRGNSKDRAAYYKIMAGIGAMTINMICEKEGFDKFDNPYADEPFIAINNMIPLSKIDEWMANQAKSAQKTVPKEESNANQP